MKLPSQNLQIVLGALLGIALGCGLGLLPSEGKDQGIYLAGLVGGVFIDLLKMVLVPLVFTSIAVGIANLKAHQQMHRVWIYTLLFFISSMALAIALAFTASHVFHLGEGLHLAMFSDAMQHMESKSMTLPEFIAQFMHGLFVNPFTAFTQPNVLGIVVFAMFVGVTLVTGGERYRTIHHLLEETLALVMHIVGWIMVLAPIGIAALLAKLVASQDAGLFATLGKFVAVVMGTTLLHGLVVLPLLLLLLTGKSPLWFLRGAREALLTAMATSSSNATMPVTLRCVEKNLLVKKDIASFVIPLGATINMDGTALYEATAALFIANLAGVELTIAQQMIVFFTAMIAAMGAPGIPSAGMVTMVMVLQSVGLPAEAIAILLPIDRLLDTLRTAVNVEGDMVGSLIVQKFVHADSTSDA